MSLLPADRYLLEKWVQSLLSAEWTAASVRRARNRLRAFAGVTKKGLLHATRQDMVAFARSHGEATGQRLEDLLRTETWRQAVRAIRLFYRWANTRYVGVASDPTVGIRQAPGQPPGVRVRPRDGRLYEAVLNAPGLSPRNQLILALLALGLTPRDVASLPVECVNLSLRLVSGGDLRRTVPLSNRAVARLGRWLPLRPPASRYLFPGALLQQPISVATVRAVVQSAARAAFPHPSQESLRRKIYATGLRHLYLIRVAHANIALSCLQSLTGIDRLSRLERFIQAPGQSADLTREFERMVRRWPSWF
jgi:integrase